jgi:hypothetical protein
MAEAKKIKARVLVACEFGKPDDVAQLEPAQIKANPGLVDTDPAAVAYAESLK